MAILPVLTFPDTRLKQIAQPVSEVDDVVRKLMDDLYETMAIENGAGLAAPQVGISKRVIAVDFSYRDPEFKPLLMANPEIIETSGETFSWDEACLSVPGQYGKVTRFKWVKVKYLDRQNKEQIYHADHHHVAGCLQHELDHLNGMLYIERVSPLKRQMIINRLRRRK